MNASPDSTGKRAPEPDLLTEYDPESVEKPGGKRRFLGLLAVFLMIQAFFLYFYVERLQQGKQDEIAALADLIASSLWSLDPRGSTELLAFTAEINDFDSLIVRESDGRIFFKSDKKIGGYFKPWLIRLGLIRSVPLSAPVIYEGNAIGAIDARWRPDTIYVYAGSLLTTILAVLAIWFSGKTTEAKKRLESQYETLERQVAERTASLETANRRLRRLHQISRAAQQSETIKEYYHIIHTNIAELMPAENFFIGLLYRERNVIEFPYFVDEMDEVFEISCARESGSLTAEVIQTGKPLLLNEEDLHDRFASKKRRPWGTIAKSWLGVPLMIQGEVIGVIGVQSYRESDLYDAVHLEVLESISHQIAVAIRRKISEEELRKSEENYKTLFAEAQKASELYQSLIHSSADAIVLYDLDGSARYISPSFIEIFGFSLEELNGRENPFVPEDEKRSAEKVMNQLISHGVPCKGFETRRHARDGRVLDVSISASRYNDHQGNPVGVLVILRDVTDSHRLKAHLNQAQKMEAVGTLAGGVSHDFNNLLQAIFGYTQVLLMDKTEHDPDYTSLKAIQNAADRAAKLVRQLLLFSRKVETERILLDLNQEIEKTRGLLSRTIPKMVEIEFNPGESLWRIKADPVQMEQILLNLGGNAADSMPDGGRLMIDTDNIVIGQDYIQTHPGVIPGNYVLLTVTDTGCGMDRRTVEHIFEPFFTTKEVGKGTGLGLASVYGIVKSQGGYIECYSEIDRGTTFRIYLPAHEVEEERPLKGRREDQFPKGAETVLLVDDEEPIRTFAAKALKRFGYKIKIAASGEEALEIYTAGQRDIDLIILDIGMPGMGGFKCLQEIIRIDPGARVLIASGYAMEGRVKESLKAGAAGYLGKPYHLTVLLKKVRDALDQNR